MIVNPLTGKHIKANGKLAQKLLKMHRDKEVKLKRGDVKLIKDGGGQHGGTECLDIDACIEKLPEHLVQYMKDTFLITDVKFLAKLACFETQYLAKYNELLNGVGLESDVNKIRYLQNAFGAKKLGCINNTSSVKRIIEKFTISDNDDGVKYREFINYTGNGNPPDGFDDYWVLKHINICCKPDRIYWLLQKIAQHNESVDGKRSYLQLDTLSCSQLRNIKISDKPTKVIIDVMPQFYNDCEQIERHFFENAADLSLDEVIELLKGIDIKRKVHIGL